MFETPNPFGECNPIQIQKFEQEFTIHIPNDYKDYLCQFNGAKPIHTICALGNEETSIHHMYGLHDCDWCRIRIENNMLIFADDPFGNEFAINLNPENNYGFIYFIDRELDNSILLHSSFYEFISSLISRETYMNHLENEFPELYARIQELKQNPQI